MGRELFPRAGAGEGLLEPDHAQDLFRTIGGEGRSVSHQSNLCWNDFIDVDFSEAILQACDLRCSLFESVRFIDTDLRAADLRRSSFKACLFDGANVQGAILTHAQGVRIALSKEQRISVDWCDDEGPEPDGG
jgi:BTB/POZ domain-containing protein KCTD9